MISGEPINSVGRAGIMWEVMRRALIGEGGG